MGTHDYRWRRALRHISELVASVSLLVAVAALLVAVYYARRQGSESVRLGSRIDRVTEAIEAARKDGAQRATAAAADEIRRAATMRRANLRNRLRAEYIASHDGISPSLMAGNADPPEEWCRGKLREWRIDEREVYG